jgi:hypothetical protein
MYCFLFYIFFLCLIKIIYNFFILGNFGIIDSISEVIIYYFNRLLLIIYEQNLTKLDFTKGIPNSCKTMVVIPTIIKIQKKLNGF